MLLVSHNFKGVRQADYFLSLCLIAFFITSTKAETIRVVTEDLPPYQIMEQDGSVGGFATEVIQALFTITGDDAQIEVMPWARAYETAIHEKNILIYSIYRTQYREKLFYWVGPLMKEHVFFWGLEDKFPQSIQKISDLLSYTIAATRYSNAEQYLSASEFIHIYKTVDEEQPMKMLLKHRVDLVIDTKLIMETRAKHLNLNISNVKALIEIPELQANLSIAFSLGTSPELVSKYQKAYQQIKSSGQLSAIQMKWGIPNLPE